jgi:hypothetical protein
VFISIIGNAGYIKTLWKISGEPYIIRHSAVVLSELRRGARGRDAERLVASLFELATVRWEPSVTDWWQACPKDR